MDDALGQITQLLKNLDEGKPEAQDELFRAVYSQLKRMAGRAMLNERRGHSLAPSDLVHQVYLKIMQRDRLSFSSRRQFFAAASTAIYRILIDHAKHRNAQKHGGGWVRISLGKAEPSNTTNLDVLALDEQMQILGEVAPRQRRIIELRYFGGLTLEEVSEILQISTSQVARDHHRALAWLQAQLGEN